LVSDAVRAGADGYVLKLSLVQELVDAIRGVLGGESQYP
jgi:DNA-binding NarL/FixJ family response regulator